MPKTSAQRRPLTYRPGFWGSLIFGLVVVAAVVIVALNTLVYNAEAAVEKYLEALRSGDGSTAMALSQAYLSDDAPATISTVLLDGEPLAESSRILADAQLVSVDTAVPESFTVPGLTQRVVEIRYEDEQGTAYTTSIVVDKVGTSWMFFNDWQLHPMPLQQIELTPSQMPEQAKADEPVARIYETSTPLLGTDGAPATLAAFAPSLIALEYQGTFLEVPETQHFMVQDVLSAGATVDFAFDVELTQAVDDAITTEVQRQLERCTQQQVLQPAGCPFGYQTANRVVPDSVSWTVDVPEVEYSWENSEPAIDRIVATAVLSAEEIDIGSGDRSTVRHEEPFEMTARLELTPEHITVHPDWQ